MASIGIPLVIDAVKKLTGGSAVRMGSSHGGAAPRIGRPLPLIGTWKGRGKKKKKKKSQMGQGLILGKHSPFNKIPIIGDIL